MSKLKTAEEIFPFSDYANKDVCYADIIEKFEEYKDQYLNQETVKPIGLSKEEIDKTVEDNFKGLRDCIEDKDIAEWYISVVKTMLEHYFEGQSVKPIGEDRQELVNEAQDLMIKLLPAEKFGENPEAERLYDILNELALPSPPSEETKEPQ